MMTMLTELEGAQAPTNTSHAPLAAPFHAGERTAPVESHLGFRGDRSDKV